MGTTYRLTATGREALKAALAADTLGPGDAWIPADLCEPVGLDMAEPDDGTVVRVNQVTGWLVAVREDDEVSVSHSLRRWFSTSGTGYSWADLLTTAVSITVLEPQRQVNPVTLPLEIGATHTRLPKVFIDRSQLTGFAARLALHGGSESISRPLFADECRVIIDALTQLANEWDAGYGRVA